MSDQILDGRRFKNLDGMKFRVMFKDGDNSYLVEPLSMQRRLRSGPAKAISMPTKKILELLEDHRPISAAGHASRAKKEVQAPIHNVARFSVKQHREAHLRAYAS